MAVVTIIPYNIRVDDADTTTNWTQIGGGGAYGADTELVYQGNASISNQGTTGQLRGASLTFPTAVNMATEPSNSVWLAKYLSITPGAMEVRSLPGLTLRLGSGTGDYNEYYIEGSDSYPVIESWRFVAIDPNVIEYVDGVNEGTVVGAPNSSSISYVAFTVDMATAVRSQNTALDAVDIGTGLNLVGGDGGDTDGQFSDFLDFDQGTTVNRYGYVTEKAGILYVNGTLTVGEETGSAQTAVATEFTDDGTVITFLNGLYATDWPGLKFNTANSNTIISLTNDSFIGEGERNNSFSGRVTSSQDTRPNFNVTGSLGSITSSGCVFQNFRSASLNDTIRLTGGTLEVSHVIQSGSHIDSVKITTTSTSSFATLQDPTFGDGVGIYNTTFVQGNDGHALKIPAAGTNTEYLLYGLKFQGYGNTTTDSASISILETTSEVTLSIFDGGDIPTYKSAGAPVLVRAPVAFTVKGAVSGSEIRIISSSGTEVGGQESNDGVSDFVYSYSYPGYDQSVFVVVHALDYVYVLVDDVTLGNTDGELTVQQRLDRNYDNPD